MTLQKLNDADLREKAKQVAGEIRTLIAGFEANGRFWKDGERERYDALNQEFDACDAEVKGRKDAAGIALRIKQIDNWDDGSVVMVPSRRRRDDLNDARNDGPRGVELRFSNGTTQRALLPHESFAERYQDRYSGDGERGDAANIAVALLTGRTHNLNDAERRAMLGSVDASGGYLITGSVADGVIDLARAQSVALQAGVPTFAMEEPIVRFARLSSDPVASWRPEGAPVYASKPTLNAVTLEARVLACAVPLSLELCESAPNAVAVARSAIAASIGLGIDSAILQGAGSASEPLGVLNTSNVNEVATVGTPDSYAKFSEAVGKVLSANRLGPEGLALVAHPDVMGVLDRLTDENGQPLAKTDWVKALRPFATTGISTANAIVGDFSQCLLGVHRSISFRVMDAGQISDTDGATHNLLAELKRLLIAYVRCDVAVIRPTWFCKMTGVTTA